MSFKRCFEISWRILEPVTFGRARSLAEAVESALKQTTKNNYARFLAASSAVLDNFYMVEFLGSIADPNEALNLSKELVSLLSPEGFRLAKFVSNVPNLAEK